MDGIIKRKRAMTSKARPIDSLYYAWTTRRSCKISTLGSSVTAGSGASEFGKTWIWRLYSHLKNNVKGLGQLSYNNNGYAGYTTSSIIANNCPDTVITQKPDVILFETCLLNDHGSNVPIETTLSNISQIIQWLREGRPQSRIIVQSPNPRSSSGANAIGLTYGYYLSSTKIHVRSLGVEYVDIYTDFLRQMNANGLTLDDVLADGVHPNDTGYGYWYVTLRDYFKLYLLN